MQLPDVNILVAGFREDSADHAICRAWLERLVRGDESFAISDLVCSGFLRIVTHPRIFAAPTPLSEALDFLDWLRGQPNCSIVAPGVRHWDIFTGLCRSSAARGNLIPDAFLAGLAIESGSEWITMDGDFARFTGLRWQRPTMP